ncbi:MAG: glycosyltransferase family 2 protein [Trichormus sp. ATA11-4-KO1]|jgi:glycosyltransferase involved in cell wall biosynthesis|nr:glycosyltransferase family 2 protein [Trichormus sp. ATA11-4-KO1]
MSDIPLVSVVMPCLNEEAAIGICIEKIQNTFNQADIDGEIIVCDNGSTDKSVEIAESMGVQVVHQSLRGYGNAYLKGFNGARGKYFIMGDADDTYDFHLIPKFLDALINENYDFVTGSRFLGKKGLENNPLLHRLIGNPIITGILNGLFGTKYTDVYCGFRAFTREAYELIEPISPGMEFNLELAINAGLAKLKIKEIPIQLAPRKGESKLRTVRDGWRSLRMMLLYAPNKLFIYPGMFLLTLGMLIHFAVLAELLKYEGRPLGVVTGIFATIFSVVGFEILSLGLHAKTYSWSRRFDKDNFLLRKFYKFFNLEAGLFIGTSMIISGSLILLYLTLQWLRSNLLPLPHPEWFTFAATIVIIGFEIDFSSLFISAMSMKKLGSYEVPK